MTELSHDISTLNSLIATTLDSVEGYTEAAKNTENSGFVTLFNGLAGERRQLVSQLQQHVSSLGGEPEDDGTILAGAHRVFLNLKSVVTGHDDKAIINEVEAGEDHIKAKYEDALEDRELSSAVQTLVVSAYTSVKAGHDEIRDIKHSMER
ncbi:PA2169 family four-helix-bundle protein [Sphingobium sp. 3R8]|uniref:PA2169 family four-helix-bundle protein n=1 Tax=Sphingobium sp. 3R8 TaxID=2874921 RepID=UPI001CCFCB91|nr:PA2169 family four-helix-bundle protein [Sphingobium sp. 3R8]MBZ9648520.1 PA2169 family four-helix-bundle protein [Sphingobium sp. 3R8]